MRDDVKNPIPRSFQEALTSLAALFKAPPILDFEQVNQREITYAFPSIRPRERRSATPPSSEVNRFFEAATRKFFYQDFRNPSVATELCWPNERLHRKDKKYVIEQTDDKIANLVNATADTSRVWFRNDVIDGIAVRRQPTCTIFSRDARLGKIYFDKVPAAFRTPALF
jgi:hypothetical protein